jgi:hypothetical protein
VNVIFHINDATRSVDLDAINTMAHVCYPKNLDEDVWDAPKPGGKVGLIKEYKTWENLSLMDAKRALDKMHTTEDVLSLFQKSGTPTDITKEEFMNLISDAIDNKNTFYANQLQAVEFLIINIKNGGGLAGVAKDRQKFLNDL